MSYPAHLIGLNLSPKDKGVYKDDGQSKMHKVYYGMHNPHNRDVLVNRYSRELARAKEGVIRDYVWVEKDNFEVRENGELHPMFAAGRELLKGATKNDANFEQLPTIDSLRRKSTSMEATKPRSIIGELFLGICTIGGMIGLVLMFPFVLLGLIGDKNELK